MELLAIIVAVVSVGVCAQMSVLRPRHSRSILIAVARRFGLKFVRGTAWVGDSVAGAHGPFGLSVESGPTRDGHLHPGYLRVILDSKRRIPAAVAFVPRV